MPLYIVAYTFIFRCFPVVSSSGVISEWCTWLLSSARGIFLCSCSSTWILVSQTWRNQRMFDPVLQRNRNFSLCVCVCRFITGCDRRGSLHLSVGSWFQKCISWPGEAQEKSPWCKPYWVKAIAQSHSMIDSDHPFMLFLTCYSLIRFLFVRSRPRRVRLSVRTSLRAFIWSIPWSPAPRSTGQTSTWMSIASPVTSPRTSNDFWLKRKGRPCWFLK